MSAPKVAICTPAYDGRAHNAYFRGVNDIRRAFASEGIETAHMETGHSANLPRLRNALCALALDWGADAILWIDSDIEANGPDALRLWNADKEIIGCAPQKRPLEQSSAPVVAFKPLPGGVITLRSGLVEVGGLATAFCLVRRAVYERMRDAGTAVRMVNPDCPQSDWFRNFYWYELEETPAGWVDDGEDFYFCRKARSLGFQCFVEPNVRPIHHEGKMRLPVNFWDLHGASFNDEKQS